MNVWQLVLHLANAAGAFYNQAETEVIVKLGEGKMYEIDSVNSEGYAITIELSEKPKPHRQET